MSYTQLLYHIVFRPKNSVPAITVEHEEKLYRYIWGFVKEKGGILFRIGGMPDHIHLFLHIPPQFGVSDFMRDLKTSANKYMRENKEYFPLFEGWGKSYCALTYSILEKDNVINYIKNQKEHHTKVSFHDELLGLLKENGVEVDMRYFLNE